MARIECPTVLINGQVFRVVEEDNNGLLRIRRPNGVKEYTARRLPDSPLYGGNRGIIEQSRHEPS